MPVVWGGAWARQLHPAVAPQASGPPFRRALCGGLAGEGLGESVCGEELAQD